MRTTNSTGHMHMQMQGRVLGEADDFEEASPVDEHADYCESGARHLQYNTFQTQLCTTLLYLYSLLLLEFRRRQADSSLINKDLVCATSRGPLPSDRSSVPQTRCLDNAWTSDGTLVPVQHSSLQHKSTSSLVPIPEPQALFPPTMADREGSRRRSDRSSSSPFDGFLADFMKHPDFKPGVVHGLQTVNENGINHQGNILDGKSEKDEPYRSHVFTETVVNGGFNFAGDMPASFARQMHASQQQQPALSQQQQQQQQPQSLGGGPQNPGYIQERVSKPITQGSNDKRVRSSRKPAPSEITAWIRDPSVLGKPTRVNSRDGHLYFSNDDGRNEFP